MGKDKLLGNVRLYAKLLDSKLIQALPRKTLLKIQIWTYVQLSFAEKQTTKLRGVKYNTLLCSVALGLSNLDRTEWR